MKIKTFFHFLRKFVLNKRNELIVLYGLSGRPYLFEKYIAKFSNCMWPESET